MTWILLVLAVAVPNEQWTPGVVRPISKVEICGTKWGKDHRFVTERMKIQVARLYGVEWPTRRRGHKLTAAELALRALWEVDHRIPRELGGADVIGNIWMQPIAEALVKDRLENQLHTAVCRGTVTLEQAQGQMRQWGRP